MNLKKSISFLLLLALAATAGGQTARPTQGAARTNALIPVPESVTFKQGRFPLKNRFTIAVTAVQDARLIAACDRVGARLSRHTGLECSTRAQSDSGSADLVVRCGSQVPQFPVLKQDESYSLEVSDRQAVLSAHTTDGAMRGLETFYQLIEADHDGYFLPAVTVHDKPRFPWRGLMIDSGRHFMPVSVIKRQLDGMAAVKLNVLHFHLTEDQGFRIESRKFPKLHEMGSDGLYYTQDEIRDIIAYAADRGIRVVPEFDMPGHSTSWFVGYPSLATLPGPYKIERTWGIMDPAFDPTNEAVYKFIDEFLGEMAALFPDPYLHIGGDESNGEHWSKNPKIQSFMKEKGIKDNVSLQRYFTERVAAIVTKHGKKMIGWDEILSSGLPKGIVVQSWRGQESLAEAAKQGVAGILSSGYYLDHMLSAAQHYAVDPLAADAALTPDQAANILGGEACMWTEYVSEETVDSRIWPRLAAIAERFWSPRSITDVDDVYRRLDLVSLELEELGLTHETRMGRMLRRLTNGKDISALQTLVDVVEPMKIYHRGENHPTNQLSPLTRLVDAARPESLTARSFVALVDGLLSDAPRFKTNNDQLVAMLKEWRDIRPALDVTIATSPLLDDAGPVARDLSDIGAAGLEAVAFLSSAAPPSKEWRTSRLALLEKASKPNSSAVELAIIPGVRQLVIAAAEIPELKNSAHSEWKKRVKLLATEKPASPGK